MTIQVLGTLKSFISSGVAIGLSLAVLSASAAEPRSGADTANGSSETDRLAKVVGSVSLVLGKAYIKSVGAPRRLVTAGSPIKVSDRITTAVNGHVHIHFADKALMSVRPSSRLEILSYDYNTERPELSEVKFDLEFGITRSISGEAAKAARQRFRLNTPIAAIGVRGTDFVVSATETTTRALVNEGAIVMAPFSSTCSSDSFGPCVANAVELTDESLQIMELNGSTKLPRLLASTEIQESTELQEEVQQAISQADAEGESNGSQASGVYVKEVAAVRVTDAASDLDPPAIALITDSTPSTVLVLADINDRQLVWGRYSVADNLSDRDRLSLSYAEAKAGREITVGNLEYGLLRTENGIKQLDKGLTTVGFSLSSARAFYNSDSGVVAMEVSGGSLDINFQNNQFATELNLNHSATGAIDFFASGRLYDGGYFHSRNDSQRIAGAVSLDGQEAGYFFERQLEGGNIQGLTLWDSQ